MRSRFAVLALAVSLVAVASAPATAAPPRQSVTTALPQVPRMDDMTDSTIKQIADTFGGMLAHVEDARRDRLVATLAAEFHNSGRYNIPEAVNAAAQIVELASNIDWQEGADDTGDLTASAADTTDIPAVITDTPVIDAASRFTEHVEGASASSERGSEAVRSEGAHNVNDSMTALGLAQPVAQLVTDPNDRG